jgi:hypothetical protein
MPSVPSLYTFHIYNDAGAPVGMRAAEFPTEAAAAEHADLLLLEHLSAACVLVCEGDRELLTRERTQTAR